MNIEFTRDVAHAIMSVQDELTANEIELDWAILPVWEELRKIALHKVNEDFPLTSDFNVKGTETFRFKSKILSAVDIPRKV
jgi:hypothetical protein